MAQDWREKLNSADPKERAEAIKEIALSGDQDNLQYLKEIVENDPDPRVQDYARKAARHLYGSPPKPAPEYTPPTHADLEKMAAAANSRVENTDQTVSKSDREAAEGKVQRAFSLYFRGDSKRAVKIFVQALKLNPKIESDPFTRSVAAEITGLSPDQALLMLKDPAGLKDFQAADEDKKEETNLESISLSSIQEQEQEQERKINQDQDQIQESQTRSTLIQSWLSFFGMTEDFFKKEMLKANKEDTFVSILVFTIASVLIFLINGFFQFQLITNFLQDPALTQALQDEMLSFDLNVGMIFFYLLIGTVIFTPISFYMSVGLQFLGARIFGGKGKFKTHAYILALIQVPFVILSGVISLTAFVPIIGFVAGLVGFVLSIYVLVLTVRAVKAVHDLSTGRVIGAIIVPPIILSAIGGCIAMAVGSSLINMISQLQ